MGLGFSSQKSQIYFPATPANVKVRRARGSKETILCSLRKIIERRCPALFEDFSPAWWLFNGHLQTLYCVAGEFSHIDKIKYDRTYLHLLDGGTLSECLDFTSTHEDLADDSPILIVRSSDLLSVGGYEAYIRAILAPACSSVEKGGLGYRGVVANIRGCAGVPVHGGPTDDLRQALLYISKRFPAAPLIGLGFSLGANIVLRYLAEEKELSRLSTACILSCPWHLKINSKITVSNLLGPYGYVSARGIHDSLVRFLTIHFVPTFTQAPFHEALMTATVSRESTTLTQFHYHSTRPPNSSVPQAYDFATVKDDATWASSLADVRVPLLTLNAKDDPIAYTSPAGVENEHVCMVVTPGGGHLGWFESWNTRWVARPVLQWCKMIVEDFVLEPKSGRETYIAEGGFLKEVGQDHIGCMEIEGGLEGMIVGMNPEEFSFE
ncbi:AB-hydrolase YheT [Guyanagaster necrorhizus]|uniref:AB-hydrolase YheT n=1 Tax=Guyanagaster necrorhizus TaxID=856835 RepID=A0A9P7VQK5_9AGAR|nr:AB-hydrolase YheT [Guyanagaster necrorhizus MCA 3950]KAG7445606.1 AB-hydrolase YheT [Guyanagaster necrorhizus MCA 3950]